MQSQTAYFLMMCLFQRDRVFGRFNALYDSFLCGLHEV